jgi:hypothetical protein
MYIDDVIALYNLSKQGDYVPNHFSTTDVLNVFSINREDKRRDSVTFPKGSRLLAPDIYSYSQDANTVHIDADKPYKLYLLKGSSLIINGAQAAPDAQMTVRDFAQMQKTQNLSHIAQQAGDMNDQAYLNQFYRQIDDVLSNEGIVTGNELEAYRLQEFTVLCYQVSFAPGAVRDVTVSYSIAAGYPPGYPQTQQAESRYEYLLNPAKYWAGFERLEIRVIPGPRRNELTGSSLPLKKGGDGSYSAVFNALPKADLSFDLAGASPNIGLIAGVCAAVVLAIIVLLVILRRVMRRRRGV